MKGSFHLIRRACRADRAGFSMVEVTLALGIAGFCLVALLGLLPLGTSQSADASKATAGTGLASAILADVRAADPAATQTTLYQVALPTTAQPTPQSEFYLSDAGEFLGPTSAPIPNGKNARYRAMVSLIAPPPAQAQQATAVDVKIWESAVLTAAPATGTTEIVTCVTR